MMTVLTSWLPVLTASRWHCGLSKPHPNSCQNIQIFRICTKCNRRIIIRLKHPMNHTGGNNHTYHAYHGQFFHESLENFPNTSIINKLHLSEMMSSVNTLTNPPFLVTANPALPPCCSYHKLFTPPSPPTVKPFTQPFSPWPR